MKLRLNKLSKFSIIVIIIILGITPTQKVNAASFRVGDKVEGVIEADFIISPDNWSSSVAIAITTPESAEVTEGCIACMYGALISSSFLIGVFVLIFMFITFHINLIIGAIFQYRIFKSVASFSLDAIRRKK